MYSLPVMPDRHELHSLVDQLPDDKLEHAATMLRFVITPPRPDPRMERIQERGRAYREQVERRFRETRKPGTISGMSGGGSMMMKNGAGYGHHGFHYWDGDAYVQQTMHYFKSQELETMQRFALSPDGSKLLYEEEISSGGKTVRKTEEFPFTQPSKSA